MEAEVKIGDRVAVWDPSYTFLGYGTYKGEVALSKVLPPANQDNPLPEVIVDGKVMSLHEFAATHKMDTPQIEMDNGQIFYGCEVHWQEEKSYRASFENN